MTEINAQNLQTIALQKTKEEQAKLEHYADTVLEWLLPKLLSEAKEGKFSYSLAGNAIPSITATTFKTSNEFRLILEYIHDVLKESPYNFAVCLHSDVGILELTIDWGELKCTTS